MGIPKYCARLNYTFRDRTLRDSLGLQTRTQIGVRLENQTVIQARVLEDVEVYPNCGNLPINFQIGWCEISDYVHETPFTVSFESIASMVEYVIANDKGSIHRQRPSLSPES